jgi:glycylpeptide N-tetradecanoyltransferase
LDAAYLYYYGTETAFEPQAEESGVLKRRLEDLIKDALIVAHQANFDVFNALTLMDNASLLESLKVRDASNCGCPNELKYVLRSLEPAMAC